MHTANNTNNYTVEALVAKYRNFVMNHANCEFIDIDDEDPWGLAQYGLDGCPDHQLLIVLYNEVAGKDADLDIQKKLSKYAEHFWKDALTLEEFTFLCDHFKETVYYLFSKGLCYRDDAFSNTIHLRKRDISIITKISSNVNAKPGNSIYIEDDILGDCAMLFPQCIILCEDDKDESALKKIRLFAAGIRYRNIGKIEQETIDIIISGSGWFPGKFISADSYYAALEENGMMILVTHPLFMVSTDERAIAFRNRLIVDKTLRSITKYSKSNCSYRYVLIIEKTEHSEVFIQIQDQDRKQSKSVDFQQINDDIFFPGYYFVERPKNGIPLSELVEFLPELLQYYNWHSPEPQNISIEQPLVVFEDLGSSFKDADMNIKTYKTGSEYGDAFSLQGFYNVNSPCALLYAGTKEVYAGYFTKKCEAPYGILDAIACFVAKKNIDLRYITSLLFDPIVVKQITAIYLDFYYSGMMMYMPVFLENIIVPYHDENERSTYLLEACYDALCTSKFESKQDKEFYRKAVRMRKHALTQSLTSIEAMFYALNAYRIKQNGELHDEDNISRSQRKTVREAFEFISQGLKDMLPALDHIASVDYSFGKPEWIDPEKFIEEYIKKNEKGWLNFKSVITWKQGHNQAAEDMKDPSTGDIILRKGDSLNLFLFPKDALERVFKNIISNAQAHGFVDKSRNDYQLRFSWHVDGMALIVEIDNNGSAIPDDRDTASLLEYGVSTNLHNDGHNGIGCNEIDDIMQRYNGNVEIVSSPEDDFPVKYILTFNRSNTVRSFKM